jgi:hypothetical protein
MARFILIDNYSDYIFGDSDDLNGQIFTGTYLEFATALGQSNCDGEYGYEDAPFPSECDDVGYHVYRVIDRIPVVTDVTDRETIDAVKRNCEYLGFVRRVTD